MLVRVLTLRVCAFFITAPKEGDTSVHPLRCVALLRTVCVNIQRYQRLASTFLHMRMYVRFLCKGAPFVERPVHIFYSALPYYSSSTNEGPFFLSFRGNVPSAVVTTCSYTHSSAWYLSDLSIVYMICIYICPVCVSLTSVSQPSISRKCEAMPCESDE